MIPHPPVAILEIVRTFNAPRERVFDAFRTLEAIMSWFGPATCRVVGGSMDFRAGGEYRFHFETERGDMTVAGRYTEITPPERIAFTWRWLEDEDWAGIDSLVSFDFREVDGQTEMRFRHTGFPTDESRSSHEHGWCGSFDKLAARA